MMKKKLPLHVKILIGMILGLGWGIFAINTGEGAVNFSKDFVHPLGTIFMNMLKLIAIPMILTSLVTGIASLNDLGKLGRIGGRTIGIFTGTTVIAVSIGLIMVNVIKPGKQMSQETREMLMKGNQEQVMAKTKIAEEVQNRPALQPLVDLFPDNVIHAAGDNGNMLQIVIFAVLLGIAITMIPKEKSELLVKVMDSANEVIMKIVDIIMILAPIGVFALLSQVIVDLAKDDPSQVLGLLSALGVYAITVVSALILHLVLVYLGIAKFVAKMNPLTFLRKIRPVQLLAFSTSSSNATLPVNMEICEKEIGVDEEITGFVLPLGATINMDGTSCYQAVATVFIAQVFNMDLTFIEQLTIVLTALLASVGSAGVPGAGVVMLVIVLNSVNVPVEGIALILGVDRIIDMIRTSVNVTGDAVVCCAVARLEGKLNTVEN